MPLAPPRAGLRDEGCSPCEGASTGAACSASLPAESEASEPAVEDEGGSGRQVQEPASGYDLNDDMPF